ncbi:MAG: hypothetical protein ACYSWR_05140 [Planctomycetota bacterium]
MLLNILRTIFVIIILAALFFNISDSNIAADTKSYHVILWSGLALTLIALSVDIFTPRKSLAALAGVFFGLLVGVFISWALAQVVDLINSIYNFGLSDTAIQGIKWMMGICICYLIISIVNLPNKPKGPGRWFWIRRQSLTGGLQTCIRVNYSMLR